VGASDARHLRDHCRLCTQQPPQTSDKAASVGWADLSELKTRVTAVPALEAVPSARVVQWLTRVDADALPADDAFSLLSRGGDDIDDRRIAYGRSARREAEDVVHVGMDDAAVGSDGSSGGSGDRGADRVLLADAVALASVGYCAPGIPVVAAPCCCVAALCCCVGILLLTSHACARPARSRAASLAAMVWVPARSWTDRCLPTVLLRSRRRRLARPLPSPPGAVALQTRCAAWPRVLS